MYHQEQTAMDKCSFRQPNAVVFMLARHSLIRFVALGGLNHHIFAITAIVHLSNPGENVDIVMQSIALIERIQ